MVKKNSFFILPLIVMVFGLTAFMQKSAAGKRADRLHFSNEEIAWITFEEAIEKNKTNPKRILIDMYTDWCGWCKKMDKETFTHPQVVKYVNTHYYAVKFNAEQKEDVVFKDQTFKFVASGARGYHELAAALMNGQMSYPTIVYLDESMNLIGMAAGYQTPQTLEPFIKFFASDSCKSTTMNLQESFNAFTSTMVKEIN